MVRVASNGALHAATRPQMRPPQGPSIDASDAIGADLSDTEHQQEAPAAQDLPLFAEKATNHKAQPGLVRRHHLHPHAERVLVFGCHHGLV